MTWQGVHVFGCPTRLHYGWGAARQVGERLAELGVSRALVVSDPGVRAAGIVDRVIDDIRAAGIGAALYAETQPNPTVANVAAGLARWREHACDGLVGLGGGSAMDAAKGIGVVAANGGAIADYVGRDNVPRDLPPLVCLPTTCGTGSEVTFNAVISEAADGSGRKLPFVSRRLAPRAALVDPALVATAPSPIIAATGADALAHAAECVVNTAADPLIDALTLGTIRMIGRNLVPATGHEPAAVAEMALAATMAGIAFNQNANAVVHAASTPVTARHHLPHGVANAVFLAAGLAFCLPAVPDRLALIADALGEDVRDLDPLVAGERGIAAVRRLLAAAGLPTSLRQAGVDPATMDLESLAAEAMTSRSIPLNPRPVTPTDLIALYQEVAG